MTSLTFVRVSLASLALLALMAASVIAQFIVRVVERGLAQSATVRVAQANICSEDSSAHFTGCSSIL